MAGTQAAPQHKNTGGMFRLLLCGQASDRLHVRHGTLFLPHNSCIPPGRIVENASRVPPTAYLALAGCILCRQWCGLATYDVQRDPRSSTYS